MKARVHIIVRGHVQGVFFRANAVEEAHVLKLTGWVKNGSDGKSVEIVAEGEKQALQKFVIWAKRGPEHAQVESAVVQFEPYTEEFSEFIVN